MSLSPTPLYQEIARLLQAIENCKRHNSKEWEEKHSATIECLVKNFMPSGCGIDCGTKINMCASNQRRLVFTFEYHHMNENGFYDGWTEHKCIVKPDLCFGIDIRITGPDRNQVKDDFYDSFSVALTRLVWQTDDCKWHCRDKA